MKLFDKILKRNKPDSGNAAINRTVVNNAFLRGYKAAKMGRLTDDWLTTQISINREIRTDIRKVRDRARDSWKNNAYVRAYALRTRANEVGAEGFSFQSKVMLKNGNDDERSNKMIEDMWTEWCKKENCTMTGQLNFTRLLWLLDSTLHRDGEIIVRKITGPSVNKFGFSLELIEPDALDETFNMQLANGNVVITGVEIDQWKRPVAYWFKKRDPIDELYGILKTGYQNLVRYPAEEIIFVIDPEHTNQLRGMSHLAPVLVTLHNIGAYSEAATFNARAGASKMGFLYNEKGEGEEYEGDEVDDGGNTITNFASGTIEQLPNGLKFQAFDPTYPNGEFPNFIKSQLREGAAGLGVQYNSLANDLEGVNFSSMRSGHIDERDNWMINQTLLRDGLIIPVFETLLKWALLTGALALNYADYDRLNKPQFNGRRWSWIDPLKDVQAAVLAIDEGLSTRTQEAAKQGSDFTEIVKTLSKEIKEADENQVVFGQKKDIKTNVTADPSQDPNAVDGNGDTPANTGNKNYKNKIFKVA